MICLVRYSGNMRAQIWYAKMALGHRNGLRVRIYGDKGSAEWFQMVPEELIFNDAQGKSRRWIGLRCVWKSPIYRATTALKRVIRQGSSKLLPIIIMILPMLFWNLKKPDIVSRRGFSQHHWQKRVWKCLRPYRNQQEIIAGKRFLMRTPKN